MSPSTTSFLTVKEVCELLSVTKTTLHYQLKIPRYRLYGCNLYASNDVEAFQNNKPIRKPSIGNSIQTLTRDELAEWLRHHTGSIKRWGWNGRGPVFSRGYKAKPTAYPLKCVNQWLVNDCRVQYA